MSEVIKTELARFISTFSNDMNHELSLSDVEPSGDEISFRLSSEKDCTNLAKRLINHKNDGFSMTSAQSSFDADGFFINCIASVKSGNIWGNVPVKKSGRMDWTIIFILIVGTGLYILKLVNK